MWERIKKKFLQLSHAKSLFQRRLWQKNKPEHA
jgi:hypothetical protein